MLCSIGLYNSYTITIFDQQMSMILMHFLQLHHSSANIIRDLRLTLRLQPNNFVQVVPICIVGSILLFHSQTQVVKAGDEHRP